MNSEPTAVACQKIKTSKLVMSDLNNSCYVSSVNTSHLNNVLDRFILHRFLGLPLFFAVIYTAFWVTTTIGGQIQDLFSTCLQILCVEKVADLLLTWAAPEWLGTVMATGVGQGIQITLSFIPVLMGMFFCLSALETSGYMARAAFVMDKVMRWVGLSGKSFVPMILGFGCNVPAVLGARILEDPRERILTILMTPFMSCGARLSIYALFVAAFFPTEGHNIIFCLYITGISVALLTGWRLRKLLPQNSRQPFMVERNGLRSPPHLWGGEQAMKNNDFLDLEESPSFQEGVLQLPPYRWPNPLTLLRTSYYRVKSFVLKAGVVIIPLCVLISLSGALKTADGEPIVSKVGKQLTPLFAPMGIAEDNWPATMGLLTGVLAKEVVVGTLSASYTQQMKQTQNSPKPLSIQSPSSLAQSPVLLGVMAERFGSPQAAVAYLLFVLLYFPCISVLATIARELSIAWAVFSGIWTTGIAYSVAVAYYQMSQLTLNPERSLMWTAGVVVSVSLAFYALEAWIKWTINRKPRALPTRIVLQEG